jgi:hypothetical protein
LTPASDIYALGWIFHAVLTGNPPFSGLPAPEILRRHREGPCPELPGEMGEWRRLLSAMTAHLPRERPRDADALLEHVDAILAGRKPALAAITPRPAPPRIEEAAGSRGARYHWKYALGPAVLVLALAWTGWCLWQWRETRVVFSMPDRLTVLHHRLATDAYQEALAEANQHPERGREIWERYLERFSGTPLEGAAKAELSNFPAPISPRGR